MSSTGKYTFLPWLKQGLSLSSNIKDDQTVSGTVPGTNGRASVVVELDLEKDKQGPSTTISQSFDLIGPGDITAFSDTAVIKNYPSEGVPDFQPNYLPYIEFYDEDLPWRYNPAIADTANSEKLRPWLFLAVLKEDATIPEYSIANDASYLFPKLTINNPSLVLPQNPESSLHAWAHVHVNGEVSTKSEIDAVRNDNPNAIISRIVSPRKLDENSSYRAFLIPTFKTGQLVGLDKDADLSSIAAMQPAWPVSGAETTPLQFPVYYQWSFNTGIDEDFEQAVQKLIPQPVPDTVGTRNMDVTEAFVFSQNFGDSISLNYTFEHFAGNGTSGNVDGDALSTAQFSDIETIAISQDASTIYVGQNTSEFIRKIENGQVTSFGNSAGSPITMNSGPRGIGVDPYTGDVYFSGDANKIYKIIDFDQGTYEEFAGSFSAPIYNIEIGKEYVYASQAIKHVIRKIHKRKEVPTVTFGTFEGTDDPTTDDPITFKNPRAMCLNPSENILYIACANKHVIRGIDLTTETAFLVAGTYGVSGSNDAIDGSNATFDTPYGLSIDNQGRYLYVADYDNHSIRRIDLKDSNKVETIIEHSADDGIIMNRPYDIKVGSDGNIYFSTVWSKRINRLVVDYNTNSAALKIGGALKTPTSNFDWDIPTDETTFKNNIKNYLNIAEDIKDGTISSSDPILDNFSNDPIVTAPLYGKWHALVNRLVYPTPVTTNNPDAIPTWVDELNQEPRHRAAAGIGTDTIINNQEELMDDAWGQVGEVLRANKLLNLAQMSVEASTALYENNLLAMPMYVQMGMTASMQGKMLRDDGGATRTYGKDLTDSNLPNATVDSAFRKVFRPGSIASKAMKDQLSDSSSTLSFDDFFDATIKDLNDDSITKEKFSTAPPRSDDNSAFASNDTDIATLSGEIAGIEAGYEENPEEYSSPFYDPVIDYSNPEPEPGDDLSVSNNIFELLTNYDAPVVENKPALDLEGATGFVSMLMEDVAPEPNIINAVKEQVTNNPSDIDESKITPVLAAPGFSTPMYEYLKNISADFILPGIDQIQDNVISLVETNAKFIESYMVGLNHEMARELLWREYPTDQRGTYFKQFWDSVNNQVVEDITDMHQWVFGKSLGDVFHFPNGTDNLVLVIRGELLRKFPNLVIYAQKAGARTFNSSVPRKLMADDGLGNPEIKYPIFQATVDPDIYFLGFDLTAEEAQGGTVDSPDGWYFVLRERPGEIQFGSDIGDDGTATTNTITDYNNLSWDEIPIQSTTNPNINVSETLKTTVNVAGVEWGENSAETAYILHQPPVMVAIHAEKMLSGL